MQGSRVGNKEGLAAQERLIIANTRTCLFPFRLENRGNIMVEKAAKVRAWHANSHLGTYECMYVCARARKESLCVRSLPKRNFNQNWKIEETYFSFPAAAAATIPFRP